MTPAGTSKDLDVQNEWEENTTYFESRGYECTCLYFYSLSTKYRKVTSIFEEIRVSIARSLYAKSKNINTEWEICTAGSISPELSITVS